ncbi:MAG: glycoside hydrolase family 28 protein [Pelobium sp.]
MIRIKTGLIIIVTICSSFSVKKGNGYLITDFGAIADGRTINTQFIQKAIDQCALSGGGYVIIPKGIFISGSIFLKDKVNLRIEEEGILKGSINPDDYPQIDTRWEGEEKKWTACLVNAIGLKGTKFIGPGRVDGSGEEWTKRGKEQRLKYGKPRLIGFQNCKNITISGLSLYNQACWGLFILYSSGVEISKLNITAAHDIPSSDGIDIDSSNEVHISDCFIDVNDDCISIKSGKDEDGLRVNRPSEEILIEKCTFAYGHGGVAMGSETSGGIRNVTVKDCIVEADNWAPIRFKSQPSRGGVVENITYKNIELKNTRKAFEFNMAWRMVNPKPPAAVLPLVRNIKLINIYGTVSAVGDMRGLANSPIQDVVFKNCNITAKRDFLMEYTQNIDTSGLHINIIK